MLHATAAVVLTLALATADAAAALGGSFAGWKAGQGTWHTRGDVLAQSAGAADCRIFAPPAKWTDYVYELKARKTGGAEGFLVLFRVQDPNHFYWWNIAGWGNRTHGLETRPRRGGLPRTGGSIKTGTWYDIRIVVKGPSIRCYLDGKLIHNTKSTTYPRGGIGLGTWMTQAEYKDIRVTTLDGARLYGAEPMELAAGAIKRLARAAGDLRAEFDALKRADAKPDDPKWTALYRKAETVLDSIRRRREAIAKIDLARSKRSILGFIDRVPEARAEARALLAGLDMHARRLAEIRSDITAGKSVPHERIDAVVAFANTAATFVSRHVARQCPPIAFIRRANYGMRGTNATMFARRTGRGAAICTVDPAKPDVPPKVIFETKDGFIFDMSPSYDAKKLLFSYKEDTNRPFHIWEINVDGTGLRQVTKGPYHDVSGIYYPDGRIVFTSSRVESYSLCQDFLACALYAVDADGSNLRRFDWTTLCTITPWVLSDGSILCTRWEYQDKNIFMWEGLWTINPDGRQLKLYHGNTLTVPNAVYGAKEIPGTKKVILTMAAHHHPPLGDIAIVDRSLGVENPKGMTKITHATPYVVTKGRHWKHTNWGPGDRLYPNSYTDPYPVTKDYSLVSDGRSGQYHIAILTHDGQVVPLYKDPTLQCFNAVPLQKRPVPNAIPGQCPQERGTGTFFVQDVYQGLLRQGVKRGQVKRLRIWAQSPKKYNTEGPRYHDHYPIIGQGSYYVKINHGTVPVDANGAAYFTAPSNTEIYFQALDENGKELIRMGSVTQITTGEQASCIGCHEDRLSPSPVDPRNLKRMSRPADAIAPPPWGAGPVDYVKQVQPIWDKYCVKCHSGAAPAKGIDLSGDKTQFYSMSYQSLVFKRYVDYFYINPGPTGNFPAMATGSWVSRLTKVLESKHRSTSPAHKPVDVDETSRRCIYAWIDANVPYYGTWDMSRPWSQGGRDVLTIPHRGRRARPKAAPWVTRLADVCRRTKIRIDPKALNFTNPQWTPQLVALLAKSAGGAADDAKARFKSTQDGDYQAVLKVLNEARSALQAAPRMDMPGGRAIPQERNFGKTF